MNLVVVVVVVIVVVTIIFKIIIRFRRSFSVHLRNVRYIKICQDCYLPHLRDYVIVIKFSTL
jgi:hypothetical protein